MSVHHVTIPISVIADMVNTSRKAIAMEEHPAQQPDARKTQNAETPDPEALLPLTPAVFHILLALADGERHGYSIMREIEHFTSGQVRLGPTTLYRSIKQMLAAGLIEELDERPDPALDDERRRYYRLTTFGRRVALAESARLDHLVAIAQAKRSRLSLASDTLAGSQLSQGGA